MTEAPAPSLLIELQCEELPPKSLRRLSSAFAAAVTDGLKTLGFLAEGATTTEYATPRRLGLLITQVYAKQPSRRVERKGPSVAAGLDTQGNPTPALAGFARSCGVEVARLKRVMGDKGEQFVHRYPQKGEALKTQLAPLIEASLKKLPIAKAMRWGAGEAEFVRPVHGVILLHGGKIVPGIVLGRKSGNKTRGHRFLGRGVVAITQADQYAETLRHAGRVVASFEERRMTIERAIRQAVPPGACVLPEAGAAAQNDILARNADLLDEVTALTEWPVVLDGHFDAAFLDVPPECLALSMQSHQRYFPLTRAEDPSKMLARFLVVANNEATDPSGIVQGNERVLRARLADARFFYETDLKTKLEARVPRLANVVYHNKLGSQRERVGRIERLAAAIIQEMQVVPWSRIVPSMAVKVKGIKQHVARAAHLAKADLLTGMVGEFPELQGVMGRYYALHDGEEPVVADAILDHYCPRHAGDRAPTAPVSIALALADKLDTLTGIYGIGLVPTGDKDPFGLRRAALGVLRILIESDLSLDLVKLLEAACAQYPPARLSDGLVAALHGFFLDRLRPYCRDRGFEADEIDAVLALSPSRLDQVMKRLEALQVFRRLPEAAALAAANKRIRNILRQAKVATGDAVNPTLLHEPEERALADQVSQAAEVVAPLFAANDYTAGLRRLAALRPEVDAFFDKVMVMAEDPALRRNRLALLTQLSDLFLGAADLSRLQG